MVGEQGIGIVARGGRIARGVIVAGRVIGRGVSRGSGGLAFWTWGARRDSPDGAAHGPAGARRSSRSAARGPRATANESGLGARLQGLGSGGLARRNQIWRAGARRAGNIRPRLDDAKRA